MKAGEARDISGVSTAELAAVFHANCGDVESSRVWVRENFGSEFDHRAFCRIVDEQEYSFTSLTMADKIVTRLGLNLDSLCETGELTVVPSAQKGAALKMVETELAVEMEHEIEAEDLSEADVTARVEQRLVAMGEEEVQRRVQRLLDLRTRHIVVTPAQQVILDRDLQRTKERRERARRAA